MNTFLPYPDFIQSAKVLDKKRCWKQVVEAKQIISILSHLQECPKDKVPWQNHPAVLMWEGHKPELMLYFNVFLNVCKSKHCINTELEAYTLSDFRTYREIEDNGFFQLKPWWVGNEEFHRAMRARLIEKDRDFYLPKFPEDEGFNGGKYLWPVMETKTFKII